MPVLVAPRGETVEVFYPKWHVECFSPSYVVEIDTGIITTGGEPYSGSYDITPTWEKQVCPTQGKTMVKDLAVESIVKLEVGNTAGGLTLTI